ncbi:hypothetical protein [Priestia aryabhattai]|uniref:hypothetical protein n=1 Tax=Priestia aryabhattai TaxID=412384 RepID=UPI00237FDBF4|nr:hypothetical protein [Priestia aryabhattai]WDW10703.1 hypothetical protein PWC21_09105 [Priestia aryabhattai]
MKESELQKELLNIIECGNLYSCINNIDDIRNPLKQEKMENFIPNYSIDYLLKQRYCHSANRVLEMISGELELINGKDIRSISLEKTERLYPDFVLVNNETEQFIIVELKRSSGAEREAVTELIAYAQELKNHLPFLSNYDYSFIVVSTVFETLLRHSIGSLILDTTINILCLKPHIEHGILDHLQIIQPDSWTDLYCAHVPSEAFVSYTMALYDFNNSYKKKDGSEIHSLLEIAGDLITHNGNRFNSHGFYIIWKNTFDSGDQCNYCISIYVLNPYIFHGFLTNSNLNHSNPLLSMLTKRNEQIDYQYNVPESIFKISEDAKNLLNRDFDPTWETPSTWSLDSDDTNLKIQKIPLLMDSWGSVGDFVRDFYLHPAVRSNYLRHASQGNLSYKHPTIGIQIINYMTGQTLFSNGTFSVKDFFLLGKSMSLLIQISTLRESNPQLEMLKSWLYWLNLYLLPAIKEIIIIHQDSKSLEAPPPTFGVRIDSNTFKNIKMVEDYACWINEHLLGMGSNGIHQLFFNIGLRNGIVLDDQYCNLVKGSEEEDYIEEFRKMEQEIVAFTKEWLKDILEDIFVKKTLSVPLEIFNMLKFQYLKELDPKGSLGSDVAYIIDNLSEQFILSTFESFFLKLIDDITPMLFVEKKPFDIDRFSGVDLDWIKEQLLKLRAAGDKYVAIQIGEGGGISLVELSKEERILSYTEEDAKNDVVFIRDLTSGVVVIEKVTWQTILEGKLFR